jgi:hypothetical protein
MVDSYGGRLSPRIVLPLLESLPAVARALLRGKIGREAIGHPHRGRHRGLARLFDTVAARPEPVELNLYVSGYEDDPGSAPSRSAGGAADASATASGPNPRKLRR